MKKLLLGMSILSLPVHACVLDKIEDCIKNNRVTTYVTSKVKKHPGKAGVIVGTAVGVGLTYVTKKLCTKVHNWWKGK